jgi:acyl-CoA synthetase (AMP-forming)/AMP-acid ligase II
VFASTETGAAFSVRDGRAGFPLAYLSEPPRGIALEVRDGILHVHSPGASAAGPDGFASTGDIVEIVDDRVFFRGRASGVVNIGGANVWPEEVENLLRSHPSVVDAVVSATPNALVGNLLVARVVAAPDAERAGLGKELRAFVRGNAPSTHVPATVKVVDELETSAAGKAVRP